MGILGYSLDSTLALALSRCCGWYIYDRLQRSMCQSTVAERFEEG